MKNEEQDKMFEAWHQDSQLSSIRYNELIVVTNERNDLLIALMGEGMETLNRVLTKALENSKKDIGNQLRMDNPYWADRYERK